jgi:hypothetical protein
MSESQHTETATVGELNDDLNLVTDALSIQDILGHIGVEHDLESVILDNSYNALFTDSENGEITEVWGVNQPVPYDGHTAYRLA